MSCLYFELPILTTDNSIFPFLSLRVFLSILTMYFTISSVYSELLYKQRTSMVYFHNYFYL